MMLWELKIFLKMIYPDDECDYDEDDADEN